MQSTLAKWALNKQLQSLGILPENTSIDDDEAFSQHFRESEIIFRFPNTLYSTRPWL
jgi:hypothetical protein